MHPSAAAAHAGEAWRSAAVAAFLQDSKSQGLLFRWLFTLLSLWDQQQWNPRYMTVTVV